MKLPHQPNADSLDSTANEVISDGLRLLKERDEGLEPGLADLRAVLAFGIADADAGKVAPLTDELVARIKARGRQRLLEEQGAAATDVRPFTSP